MSDNEDRVLQSLMGAEDYCGFCFLNFDSLIRETGLDRKQVRRACRSLARKGLAEFGKGLWTEDGEPAGSGYAATKAVWHAPVKSTKPQVADGVAPARETTVVESS